MRPALDPNHAVPEAVRPPPGNPRFPLFDGLRAIAALLIVLNHGIFASGYSNTGALGRWTFSLAVGVPIFFAISGFLLYRPFVQSQMSRSPGPETWRFYRRRLLRIIPAYWLALTVLSIYPLSQDMFLHWPKYYFFLQIYTPSDYGIGIAWSLCVEMGFYLILPAYVWAMGRTLAKLGPGRRVKMELCVLAGLSAVSAVLFYSAQYGHAVLVLNSVFSYLYWFAAGMALAIVSVWEARRRELGQKSRVIDSIRGHAALSWLAAFAFFVLIGALAQNPQQGGYDNSGASLIRWFLGPLVAVAAVLPAVFSGSGGGLPARLLSWRPLAWVGLVSYAVFLWHNPIIAMISRQGWVHGGTQVG
ncbi:MAG: acyltransferase, partial [Actinomycetota bacterium]